MLAPLGSRILKSPLRGEYPDFGLHVALSGQAARAREVPHVSRNCHLRTDVLAPYAHSWRQKKASQITVDYEISTSGNGKLIDPTPLRNTVSKSVSP